MGSDGLSYSGTVGNKIPKYREDKNEGQSQSAYVKSYENLRCGASTCISFYHVIESESVVHNENVVHIK